MSTPGRPRVAVLLGTDHHPFGRLVSWVERVDLELEVEWFVQHGATPGPQHLPGAPLVDAPTLEALLRDCAAVVTHGGPGLIMEARTAGHLPIVVARDPAQGEHVDGHQQRFVRRIGAAGLITAVDSCDDLATAVRAAALVGPSAAQKQVSGLPLQLSTLVEDQLQARRESHRGRRPAWLR